MFSDLHSQDVHTAAERIRGVVRRTDLRRSAALSEIAFTDVFLKLECEQTTGSFKLRGAYNALASLPSDKRTGGVIAASAGNHGLGIAYAARALGIPAMLYIPSTAPAVKRDGIVALGATVDATSPDYDHALARAIEHAEREGLPFVSATGDPAVIAGQGTAALEILEELDEVRTIILPVGGAGLLAGFGSLIRAEAPTVRIVGVQGTRSDAMARALEAGKLVSVSHEHTLADGLSGDIDDLAFDVGKHSLDVLAIVTEDEIAMAIAWLSREEGLVVEGSGAVGVAALLQKKIYRPQGPVVVVLSGGNIDSARHADVVARYGTQGASAGTSATSVSPL
ncbi:MAG: threonine/serine dehydratase [Gemmatimonadota bacterium]